MAFDPVVDRVVSARSPLALNIVHLDSYEAAARARPLGVGAIPMTFLLGEDGMPLDSFVGYRDATALRAWLEGYGY